MSALVILLGALGWQAATRSVDFPIYHRIASQVWAGSYEIYPPEVYSGGTMPPHGFRYLPAIAFLFVPFAWLPLPLAAGVFYAVKLAALAWTGRTLARHTGVEGWATPLTALFIVAGYAAEELRYGNAHLLTVALIVFAYDRVRAGRVTAPAVALALAMAMKLTPVAVFGYFALRRHLAACAATLVAFGALVVLPAPVVGWEANNRLLSAFVRYAVEKVDETDNYSLRGALAHLASGTPSPATSAASTDGDVALVTWAWLALVVAIGIVTLVTLWRAPPDDCGALLDLSIVLVVMLIASPHSQRRHFVQLFVPAVALLGLIRVDAGRFGRLAWTGLAVTAAAGTVLPLLLGGRRLALSYESTSPYFWSAAVLLMVLWRAVTLRKRRAAAS